MKLKPIVIAASLLLTAAAWANGSNADTTAPAPVDAPPAMSMDMPMPMPADDASADTLQQMDANLDKMHQALAQMKDTKDPAERQKLMQDYMSAQHDNMMLARSKLGLDMMGPGMAGGGMGGMDMGGKGKKMDDPCARGDKGADKAGGMDGMDMGGKGKKGCDMGGMGKKGCGMGGMGGMGGMKDDATAARLQSLEKRLDMLQDMMRMMMGH